MVFHVTDQAWQVLPVTLIPISILPVVTSVDSSPQFPYKWLHKHIYSKERNREGFTWQTMLVMFLATECLFNSFYSPTLLFKLKQENKGHKTYTEVLMSYIHTHVHLHTFTLSPPILLCCTSNIGYFPLKFLLYSF